jgi:hypothetical protein
VATMKVPLWIYFLAGAFAFAMGLLTGYSIWG